MMKHDERMYTVTCSTEHRAARGGSNLERHKTETTSHETWQPKSNTARLKWKHNAAALHVSSTPHELVGLSSNERAVALKESFFNGGILFIYLIYFIRFTLKSHQQLLNIKANKHHVSFLNWEKLSVWFLRPKKNGHGESVCVHLSYSLDG